MGGCHRFPFTVCYCLVTNARIRFAYETCLARPPRDDERERMSWYLARMTDEFETDRQAVEALGAKSASSAAWTAASRVLINLDENAKKGDSQPTSALHWH